MHYEAGSDCVGGAFSGLGRMSFGTGSFPKNVRHEAVAVGQVMT